jgi:perosamine synthetase
MRLMFHTIISASLSPNTEIDDVMLAFRFLFRPWEWTQGHANKRVEEWFGKRFPNHRTLSFNSGRSAFLAILKAFDIHEGDEVMVQAFTCVAVPNSVLWAGARPVYIDIDSTLNMDVDDAEKKMTKKTRAIVVQHTLGIPARMDRISAFAKKNNLLVIEDCAHSLGATSKGENVGSMGDAAFFSFGRDKVVSSVFGGMAIIHKRYEEQWTKLKDFHKLSPKPKKFWIFQQLLHPVIFSMILPFYTIGIGKVILVLCQRLKLLSIPVYPEEKIAKKPHDFPAKYPNALAHLLINQLKKLERYNDNRKVRAHYYLESLKDNSHVELLSYPEGSIFLRFPILLSDPKATSLKAKKAGILIGNWYHNTIDPIGVDFRKIFYVPGSCPFAEHVAKRIINLPTNISKKDAVRVLKAVS